MQSAEAGRSRAAALSFLVWDIFITTEQEVSIKDMHCPNDDQH